MKSLKSFLFTVGCILIIAGLVAVGCSDDDNPASSALKGSWTSLGSGMEGGTLGTSVRALTVYDENLIAGGDFNTAGGVSANNIATWDGSAWSPLGTGTNSAVFSLAVCFDYLFAGGAFTTAGGSSANHFAGWDGSSWGSFGAGRGTFVYALIKWSTQVGDAVGVGGVSGTNGGLAVFNGLGWMTMASDITVYDFAIYDNEVIIGGTFNDMAGESGDNIIAFDGSESASLGEGTAGPVLDLTVFDGKLIAGGDFTHAGGIDARHIAAWDGSSWKALGSGTDNIVMAVTSYGNMLIVGGQFTTAGGVSAPGIASWDPE